MNAADAQQCEALRLKLQRDLNCLADHDRVTRRTGMKRLVAALQDSKTQSVVMPPKTTKGGLRCLFSMHLLPILVRLFADAEVDFCRESSMRLVLMFVLEVLPASKDAGAEEVAAARAAAQTAASLCVPKLVARVGVQPSPEGTEEVRLLAIRLVAALLSLPGAVADFSSSSSTASSSSSSTMSIAIVNGDESDEDGDSSSEAGVGRGVCTILARSLGDQYPEVKRECCATVRALVVSCPSLASRHGEPMLAGLVGALGHQHAKTRQLALTALGQLVVCCASAAAGLGGGSEGGSSGSGSKVARSDLAVAAEASSAGTAGLNGMELDERLLGGESGLGLGGSKATSRQAAMRKCFDEVVFPALHRAAGDGSPMVRLTAARCSSFLLRARPLKTPGLAALGLEKDALGYLLALTADQAADVQRTAHECLHTASQHWADHHLAPGAMMLSQQPLKPLPPPSAFTSLPGEGQELEAKTYGSVDVAAICAHLAPSLIAPLLAACGHWTARERERGLQALAALAGACRHPSTAEPLADKLPQIMQILCTSLVDDEDEVSLAAQRCAAAFGHGACLSDLFKLALPRVIGAQAGTDTAPLRAQALRLVACLLGNDAASPEAVAEHTPAVCNALADPGLLLHGWDADLSLMDRQLADALLITCQVVIDRGIEQPNGALLLARGADANAVAIANTTAAAAVGRAEEGGGSSAPLTAAQQSQVCVTQLLRVLGQLQGAPVESVPEDCGAEAAACVEDLAVAVYATAADTLPPPPPSGAESEAAAEVGAAARTAAIHRIYAAHLPTLLRLVLNPAHTVKAKRAATDASDTSGGGSSNGTSSSSSDSSSGSSGNALQAVSGTCAAEWRNAEPSRRAFDALLRVGASAAGPSLEAWVLPAVLHHVGEGKDADLKLSMLCLLEVLIARPESSSFWPPHVVPLISHGLQHNMVWRSGRVAGTVRKVAIVCFYGLLRRGYADRKALFQVAPALLPVLKTDLDDFDASTRELCCLSLDLMFKALPGALSEQPVHELYPSLLKRLDDSADPVRYAVCGCFANFFAAAPPSAFRGTTLDYSLDQLLVHLDDADPKMQERVFAVLQAALPIDAPKVAKKALAVRSTHRDPVFIDQLVAAANRAP